MTTISQVRFHLRHGAWLPSINLEDSYWHVPVHTRLRMFLAFQVGEEMYLFRVMPFSLLLAPRVITKLTCCLWESLLGSLNYTAEALP